MCALLEGLHVLSLRQHDPHTRKEQLVLPADASQKIVYELEEMKRNSVEKDDRLGSAARGCPLIASEKSGMHTFGTTVHASTSIAGGSECL